jgi:hypothetical protein
MIGAFSAYWRKTFGTAFVMFVAFALSACQSDDNKAKDNSQASNDVADTRAQNLAPEKINDLPASTTLDAFFKALGLLKKNNSKQVTILHLGDTHIAADRFSGDLREEFQNRFGNAGRGMLMPGLYMARGIRFEQGGKWQTSLSTEGAEGPYSLTGAKLATTGGDAWLRLTTTDRPFAWCEVTFGAGRGGGTVFVGADGDLHPITTNESQNWKTIHVSKEGRELLVKPKGDGPVTVHSIVVGNDGPGIRYVSLGLPGATADTPLLWDEQQLTVDLKRLSPDLIILSYGTAESLNDNLNIADYGTHVATTLAHLKQIAPNASFLVIGPPDIARRPSFAAGFGRMSDVCRALGAKERLQYATWMRQRDSRLAYWHPPLNLEAVRTTLRRTAAENQAFFWDWSKSMGGTCGIHAWVHSDPPLAAANHLYLNEEGSKRSAKMLFRELMTAFDAFERDNTAVSAKAK